MNVKNMRKAIRILKTSKDMQVQNKFREFSTLENTKGTYDKLVVGYCATGLLGCKMGYYDDPSNTDGGIWSFLTETLDVPDDYVQDIINMNDSPDRYTFKQIAKKMKDDLDWYLEGKE